MRFLPSYPNRKDCRARYAFFLPHFLTILGVWCCSLTDGPSPQSGTRTIEPRCPSSPGDRSLDDDGHAASDSSSGEKLRRNHWLLLQIKTSRFTTDPTVRQRWHCLMSREKRKQNAYDIEHQVLKHMLPVGWSRSTTYDFHLRLRDIRKVMCADGNTLVVLIHEEGDDGWDREQRGHVMVQFKTERMKEGFLRFLKKKSLAIARSDP
jgi:hypothetical protein